MLCVCTWVYVAHNLCAGIFLGQTEEDSNV